MTLIIVLMIVGGVLLIAGSIAFAETEGEGFIGMIIPGAVLFVVMLVCMLTWYQSGIKAEYINAKYKTEYTAKDIFWAGETIEKTLVGSQHNLKLEE